MKQPIYFIHPCRLERKNNSIGIQWKWDIEKPFISPASIIGEEIRNEFQFSEEESWWLRVPSFLPIERIDSIHLMAPVDLNTEILELLYKKEISIHQYDWEGMYVGSFNGNRAVTNGLILSKQVKLQDTIRTRIKIAKLMIEAGFKNMLRLVNYHNRKQKDNPLFDTQFLKNGIAALKPVQQLDELMGVEGSVRKIYYEWFDTLLPESMQLNGRSYRPTLNPANALLSFLNSLVYGIIESELYHTPLSPYIGILHQPGRDKQPLVYDLSEIFKPILVDPIFLMLIRKKMVNETDFLNTEKGFLLKKETKLKVVRAFSGKIHTTLYDEALKRNVSYRSLIRMEAYKLQWFMLEKTPYKPYIHNW